MKPRSVADVREAVDDPQIFVLGGEPPLDPRCQPSISAIEKTQAMDPAQAAASSPRQGSRAASDGPYATTRAAMVSAAGVPGPR